MDADVYRGSRHTGLYVISVLSWSKFLIDWELHSLCLFTKFIRNSYVILRKSYAFVRNFCEMHTHFLAFHDRSTYAHVCLTDLSRMCHRCITFVSRMVSRVYKSTYLSQSPAWGTASPPAAAWATASPPASTSGPGCVGDLGSGSGAGSGVGCFSGL